MIFKLAAGSKRLKDAQYGPYPLFLEGTVHVRGRDLKPDVFTASARTEFQSTNYELGGDGQVLTEDGADDGAGGTGKAVTNKGASQRSASASNVEVGRGAPRRLGSAAEGKCRSKGKCRGREKSQAPGLKLSHACLIMTVLGSLELMGKCRARSRKHQIRN
jgi:hypothetical protein